MRPMLDAVRSGRLITLAWGLAVGVSTHLSADESLQPVPSYAHLVAPLVDNYCSACHTGDDAEGGLSFDKVDGGDDFQQHRAEWKEMARRLREGTMPPADADPVPADELHQW